MRVLKFQYVGDVQELVLEKSFLWIKYTVTYRKRNTEIFKYKAPDRYIVIGAYEWIDVNKYFKYNN